MPKAKLKFAAPKAQKLSRSKIELLTECPRCFWLDVKHKVKRPPPAPYTINSAIDWLLKQEFDTYRGKGKPHPVMVAHGVVGIPFEHADLNKWRHNFTGVQFQHEPSGFLVTGAVDDVWVNPGGELHVVDYKATGANQHNIYDSYRRQMEVYQWLLRQNGFDVSPVGYFVFARVSKAGGFGANAEGDSVASLPFDLFVESISGDDSWIPQALLRARQVFEMEKYPEAAPECEYCAYREAAAGCR